MGGSIAMGCAGCSAMEEQKSPQYYQGQCERVLGAWPAKS